MRRTYACIFLVLAVFSVVAWRTQPKRISDGKIPLVWISDDNPVRREQRDLFNRLNPAYHLDLDPSDRTPEKDHRS